MRSAQGVDHAWLACGGLLEAENAHHPVLACEDLLKVLESDVLFADLHVAHTVKAAPSKRLICGLRIPAPANLPP